MRIKFSKYHGLGNDFIQDILKVLIFQHWFKLVVLDIQVLVRME